MSDLPYDLSYAVGQAVFVRTDTPDFEEKSVPFTSLEELVKICTDPKPNLQFEKIIVHCMAGNDSAAVSLGFISASKGAKPSAPTSTSQQNY